MAEFTEKHHYKYLELEIKDRVGTISLNRPKKRNALNFNLIHELRTMLKEVETNQEAKVVVLKANGPVFCAGSDLEHLEMLQKFSFEDNFKDSNFLKELFLQIYRHPKIIIAQVEGPAIAEGAGLAAVCDFAFASTEATFAFSEVRIGFIPAIVMYFLTRKVGETRARELLLSGNTLSSELATHYDLINGTFPADQIGEEVAKFATQLCTQNSGAAMGMTKRMLADLPKLGLDEGLNFAAKMSAHARKMEDCQKGIDAFINKEELNW